MEQVLACTESKCCVIVRSRHALVAFAFMWITGLSKDHDEFNLL